MKKVLIVDGSGAYSFNMARSLSYCKEIELHLLTLPTEKYSSQLKYVHCHQIDSYANAEQWIASIRSVVEKYHIDLIMAGDEKSTRFLIEHQAILSQFARLPDLPDITAIDLASNKASLSEFMSKHKLSQPASFVYKKATDLTALSRLTPPLLFKFPSGVGGEGIKKFTHVDELETYLTESEFSEEVLCQEYINGRDICISVLCKNGDITAYTIQQCLIENPKTYAPSLAIEFVQNERVLDEAAGLLKLLNWQGVAHIDMRINDETGDVYIIEMNPRFWESLMASLAAGVNFSRLYCQQMLGEHINFNGYKKIQYIRIKTLLELVSGKHKLLSKWRPFSLRTGLSFHLYRLRRWLSVCF